MVEDPGRDKSIDYILGLTPSLRPIMMISRSTRPGVDIAVAHPASGHSSATLLEIRIHAPDWPCEDVRGRAGDRHWKSPQSDGTVYQSETMPTCWMPGGRTTQMPWLFPLSSDSFGDKLDLLILARPIREINK
jgi:hypothetical protein